MKQTNYTVESIRRKKAERKMKQTKYTVESIRIYEKIRVAKSDAEVQMLEEMLAALEESEKWEREDSEKWEREESEKWAREDAIAAAAEEERKQKEK